MLNIKSIGLLSPFIVYFYRDKIPLERNPYYSRSDAVKELPYEEAWLEGNE